MKYHTRLQIDALCSSGKYSSAKVIFLFVLCVALLGDGWRSGLIIYLQLFWQSWLRKHWSVIPTLADRSHLRSSAMYASSCPGLLVSVCWTINLHPFHLLSSRWLHWTSESVTCVRHLRLS